MVVKQDLLQDPPAVSTIEHQTQTDTTDEPQTQETTPQDDIVKVLPYSVLYLHIRFLISSLQTESLNISF